MSRRCRIAIPNFSAGTGADNEVSVGVSQVITNNLKRSGLFAPIDPAAFVEKAINIDAPPNFVNWKTVNAQALVDWPHDPAGRWSPEGRIPAVGRRHRSAIGWPAIFHLAGILASYRPHHFRPDL